MDSGTSAEQGPQRRALEQAVLEAWNGFFVRFRPDEHDFEQQPFLEESQELNPVMASIADGPPVGDGVLVRAIALLEQFAQRRFEEQNRRIDELVDLCEQMRQRLEAAELTRSHLEDEFAHCHAIVKTALQRHQLGPPGGLPHPPRLHNLFNHLLQHFEPKAKTVDTDRYVKSPEHAKRHEEAAVQEPVFDYDRLRRLFRKP